MSHDRLRRTKPSSKRAGFADSTDYSYNDKAGAQKSLGLIMGHLIKLGALGSAVGVGQGEILSIFNNSATVAWAKTGNSSVSGPVAGDIALPPYAYTTISMGDDTHVIASAATCFGYKLDDDTVYTP